MPPTTWFDTLDATQRGRLQPVVGSLVNPFLGESPELVGRDGALRRVFEKLRAGNHCSVVGPMGSGKSALLNAVLAEVPSRLAIRGDQVGRINFRSVTDLRDLQEATVSQLGGCRADEWRRLMQAKPLRLLVLDHLGGMDPGAQGLRMRCWLLGLDDFRTRLLLASNERLDLLFRKDDPLRDSPLAGLDPIPVELPPLAVADCERLVAQRLAGCGLPIDAFADLWRAPQQPRALLWQCAQRLRGPAPRHCRYVKPSFRQGLAESRHREVNLDVPSMASGSRQSLPGRRGLLNLMVVLRPDRTGPAP